MNKSETIIEKYIAECRQKVRRGDFMNPLLDEINPEKLEKYLKSALEGVVRDTLEQVEELSHPLFVKKSAHKLLDEIYLHIPKDTFTRLKSSLVGKEDKNDS